MYSMLYACTLVGLLALCERSIPQLRKSGRVINQTLKPKDRMTYFFMILQTHSFKHCLSDLYKNIQNIQTIVQFPTTMVGGVVPLKTINQPSSLSTINHRGRVCCKTKLKFENKWMGGKGALSAKSDVRFSLLNNCSATCQHCTASGA